MLLEDVKNYPNTEAGRLLEEGTMISTKIKGNRIISVYYYQGEFEEIVFNCKTNQVEEVKKTTDTSKLNIFFEDCSINKMIA